MVAIDSLSSGTPYDWLMPMHPSPSADTSRPSVPSFLFGSIRFFDARMRARCYSAPIYCAADILRRIARLGMRNWISLLSVVVLLPGAIWGQTPPPDGLVSPEVAADRSVTFRVRAPK